MKIRLLNRLNWPKPGLVNFGVVSLTVVGVAYYSGGVSQQISREVKANMAVKVSLLAELVSQRDLANSLDLPKLSSQLSKITWSQTGYVLILERTGRLLAHPPSAYGAGNQLLSLINTTPIQQIWSEGEGSFVFEDDKGLNWVAYGQRLEKSHLILIVQPERELFASQKKVQILSWMVTSLTAISLGLLANFFDRVSEQLAQSCCQLKFQIQDYTVQSKKTQKAADRTKGAKDRLIANLSPELSTFLQLIFGYAQLRRKKLSLNSRSREKFSTYKLKWRIKGTRVGHTSQTPEDLIAQAKVYSPPDSPSTKTQSPPQETQQKTSNKQKKKTRPTQTKQKTYYSYQSSTSEYHASSSHQHQQGTEDVEEIREQFLSIFEKYLLQQREDGYKISWIWYKLKEEFIPSPLEICWLSVVFRYSPYWSVFKTEELYGKADRTTIFHLITTHQQEWLDYFQTRWGIKEEKQQRQQNRRQHKTKGSRQHHFTGQIFVHHTYLQILGLTFPFTLQELKSAYRRRAIETHPDNGGTAEAFRSVHTAYQTLLASYYFFDR